MSNAIRIDFDFLSQSSKEDIVAVCKHLGLKRDWARVTKAEMIAMMRRFGPSVIVEALKAADYTADDIQDLILDGEGPDAEEAETVGPADEAETPFCGTEEAEQMMPPAKPAKPAKPASAPDVSQVAGLLAQLLATGKAGVDADEVRGIIAPMLVDHTSLTASMIHEAVKGVSTREIVVKTERAEVKIDGLQHFKFESLLRACSARNPDGNRLNIWLYGPPGTGKTTAARNAAQGLGLEFYCTGALMSKYDIVGFIDASGKLVRSTFREAWEHGGVFLFDEIDGSAPQAIVAFNAALANGVMAFPDGMVARHSDCVIVAAANTNGLGATADFVGRMKLDAASLDRYVFIDWPVDEAIERAMCAHPAWAKLVQTARARVAEKGIKGVMVTPRATMHGSALLAQGLSMEDVKVMVLRKGMTAEQWASLAL